MSVSHPFNRPTLGGREACYIGEVLDSGHFAGGGPFTQRVEENLKSRLGAPGVLLTHSCTAALEIAALLTVKPGDEVILPSFAYATTASAFARCGAKLVFVDVQPDTLNIDPRAVEAAITPRTRAIVPVHYAGVGCDIAALKQLADSANLALIEDAAHTFGAHYGDRPLGTFGQLAALSFHETKNVISGEGGALVVNDPALIDRAQIIRDRGTNRENFLRGQVHEYSWVDLGSAYAPSEIVAAFLLAQIERVDDITSRRLNLWLRYHEAFEPLERRGLVRRPIVSNAAAHNGHIYYLLLTEASRRPAFMSELRRNGINVTSHYSPLHSAPAGLKFGRAAGSLAVTDEIAGSMVRLPLHLAMSSADQDDIIDGVVRELAR
jgi:dTDP-4-amino-4,6-dideoxygalactose transaminase